MFVLQPIENQIWKEQRMLNNLMMSSLLPPYSNLGPFVQPILKPFQDILNTFITLSLLGCLLLVPRVGGMCYPN